MTEQEANKLASNNRLKPLEPYANTQHPWRLLCLDCGRESRSRLDRLRENRGCIYCKSRRKVDPEVAAEMARSLGLEPLESYQSARRPWRVVCLECGTEWNKTWGAIREGHGCALCSQVYVSPEAADADFTNNGFTPHGTYVNARTYRSCTCNKCGHRVDITREQVINGRPCPYCSGNAIHPEEAKRVMLDAGLEPLVDFESVDVPWVSRCSTCSKTVAPTFRTVRGGGRCVYCAERKVDPEDALKVMESVGLEPLEPYPGGRSPWRCRCTTCHHVVSPTMTRVKAGGSSGCAYCSNRRVDPEDAVAIMEAAGFTPLEPYPKGKKGWLSRCNECGKESSPHFSSVQGGSACRWCRPYGIDLAQPATLYIITNSELSAHKVGIAQASSPRIAVHKRYGWTVVKTYSFHSGFDARAVEQSVIDWIRTVKELPPYLSADVMPQGGWTETVSANGVTELELINAVQLFRSRFSNRQPHKADFK